MTSGVLGELIVWGLDDRMAVHENKNVSDGYRLVEAANVSSEQEAVMAFQDRKTPSCEATNDVSRADEQRQQMSMVERC